MNSMSFDHAMLTTSVIDCVSEGSDHDTLGAADSFGMQLVHGDEEVSHLSFIESRPGVHNTHGSKQRPGCAGGTFVQVTTATVTFSLPDLNEEHSVLNPFQLDRLCKRKATADMSMAAIRSVSNSIIDKLAPADLTQIPLLDVTAGAAQLLSEENQKVPLPSPPHAPVTSPKTWAHWKTVVWLLFSPAVARCFSSNGDWLAKASRFMFYVSHAVTIVSLLSLVISARPAAVTRRALHEDGGSSSSRFGHEDYAVEFVCILFFALEWAVRCWTEPVGPQQEAYRTGRRHSYTAVERARTLFEIPDDDLDDLDDQEGGNERSDVVSQGPNAAEFLSVNPSEPSPTAGGAHALLLTLDSPSSRVTGDTSNTNNTDAASNKPLVKKAVSKPRRAPHVALPPLAPACVQHSSASRHTPGATSPGEGSFCFSASGGSLSPRKTLESPCGLEPTNPLNFACIDEQTKAHASYPGVLQYSPRRHSDETTHLAQATLSPQLRSSQREFDQGQDEIQPAGMPQNSPRRASDTSQSSPRRAHTPSPHFRSPRRESGQEERQPAANGSHKRSLRLIKRRSRSSPASPEAPGRDLDTSPLCTESSSTRLEKRARRTLDVDDSEHGSPMAESDRDALEGSVADSCSEAAQDGRRRKPRAGQKRESFPPESQNTVLTDRDAERVCDRTSTPNQREPSGLERKPSYRDPNRPSNFTASTASSAVLLSVHLLESRLSALVERTQESSNILSPTSKASPLAGDRVPFVSPLSSPHNLESPLSKSQNPLLAPQRFGSQCTAGDTVSVGNTQPVEPDTAGAKSSNPLPGLNTVPDTTGTKPSDECVGPRDTWQKGEDSAGQLQGDLLGVMGERGGGHEASIGRLHTMPMRAPGGVPPCSTPPVEQTTAEDVPSGNPWPSVLTSVPRELRRTWWSRGHREKLPRVSKETWVALISVLPGLLFLTAPHVMCPLRIVMVAGDASVYVRRPALSAVLDAVRYLRVLRLHTLGQRSRNIRLLTEAVRRSAVWFFWFATGLLVAVVFFAACFWTAETAGVSDARLVGGYDGDPAQWVRDQNSAHADAGQALPAQSMADGLWWSLVTSLAVGYGDVVPYSGPGKLVGAAVMVTSMLTVAFPISILTQEIREVFHEDAETRTGNKQRRSLLAGLAGETASAAVDGSPHASPTAQATQAAVRNARRQRKPSYTVHVAAAELKQTQLDFQRAADNLLRRVRR
ncbi:Potassium voltage-gated channel protein Shaker [Diplonema papillatum]|nr:Potassium voltage-gated channel protein Shaker [Diplonema papillatum]